MQTDNSLRAQYYRIAVKSSRYRAGSGNTYNPHSGLYRRLRKRMCRRNLL